MQNLKLLAASGSPSSSISQQHLKKFMFAKNLNRKNLTFSNMNVYYRKVLTFFVSVVQRRSRRGQKGGNCGGNCFVLNAYPPPELIPGYVLIIICLTRAMLPRTIPWLLRASCPPLATPLLLT